jgi:hypothetical protein
MKCLISNKFNIKLILAKLRKLLYHENDFLNLFYTLYNFLFIYFLIMNKNISKQ